MSALMLPQVKVLVAHVAQTTLQQMLSHIQLRNFPYSLRLIATGENTLTVRTLVTDRDGDRNVEVDFHTAVPAAFLTPCPAFSDEGRMRAFAIFVRKFVGQAVMHEIDESFLVDGYRIFDPHLVDNSGED